MARRPADLESKTGKTAGGKAGKSPAATAATGKPAPEKPAERIAKDVKPAAAPPVDPAVAAYAEGLVALYRKDWPRAAELLQAVLDQGDSPELSDRARQLLAASRQRAAEEAAARAKAVPKDEDPYLRALFEKNRGDLAGALALCQQDGRDQKDERFAYLAAAIHAVERRTDEAAKVLARAIELNPKNRIHAYHDPDFADLRKNHRHVFGL